MGPHSPENLGENPGCGVARSRAHWCKQDATDSPQDGRTPPTWLAAKSHNQRGGGTTGRQLHELTRLMTWCSGRDEGKAQRRRDVCSGASPTHQAGPTQGRGRKACSPRQAGQRAVPHLAAPLTSQPQPGGESARPPPEPQDRRPEKRSGSEAPGTKGRTANGRPGRAKQTLHQAEPLTSRTSRGEGPLTTADWQSPRRRG